MVFYTLLQLMEAMVYMSGDLLQVQVTENYILIVALVMQLHKVFHFNSISSQTYILNCMLGYGHVSSTFNKDKTVVADRTIVCLNGAARFRTDIAKREGNAVTDNFITHVKNLPDQANYEDYMKFINKYGTVSIV